MGELKVSRAMFTTDDPRTTVGFMTSPLKQLTSRNGALSPVPILFVTFESSTVGSYGVGYQWVLPDGRETHWGPKEVAFDEIASTCSLAGPERLPAPIEGTYELRVFSEGNLLHQFQIPVKLLTEP